MKRRAIAGRISIACFAIAAWLLLILLSGCSTFEYACAGQAADFVSTSIALNQPGMVEGNPIYAGLGEVVVGKIILIGCLYCIDSDWLNYVAGHVGIGCAGWNTYQILDAPWEGED